MRLAALTDRGSFPTRRFPTHPSSGADRVQDPRGYQQDQSRVPATSAHARLSRFDVATAVAAARASTAWAGATAAHTPAVALAVFLAEQLVRIRGKFLSAPEMLGSGHGCSIRLAAGHWSDTAQAHRRTTRRDKPPGVRDQGCTELHYAAPALTDSTKRRFSTQISTQRGAQRSSDAVSPGHSLNCSSRPECASSQAGHPVRFPPLRRTRRSGLRLVLVALLVLALADIDENGKLSSQSWEWK